MDRSITGISCLNLRPRPHIQIVSLSKSHAKIRANWDEGNDDPVFYHPLKGKVRAGIQSDAGYTVIEAPAPTPGFPQLDVTSGETWSVWPLWALMPVSNSIQNGRVTVSVQGSDADTASVFDLSRGDGLCWMADGLTEDPPATAGTSIRLQTPPDTPYLRSIFDDAMHALTRWYGPLPWTELNVLVEEQAEDTFRQRGFAHRAANGSVWCRALLRPGSTRTNRAEATELIVHELLHLLLEFDTPPGHLLTEGLITYLARRLLVSARLVPGSWLDRQNHLAQREARQSGWQRHSLDWATDLFFESLEARRLAYRKGHIAMFDLDRELNWRLPQIARNLARLSALRRAPLNEVDFVNRLPLRGRLTYKRALTGVGVNTPGAKALPKTRGRLR